jgi:hypothetical protein
MRTSRIEIGFLLASIGRCRQLCGLPGLGVRSVSIARSGQHIRNGIRRITELMQFATGNVLWNRKSGGVNPMGIPNRPEYFGPHIPHRR